MLYCYYKFYFIDDHNTFSEFLLSLNNLFKIHFLFFHWGREGGMGLVQGEGTQFSVLVW